jgi:hypothetical protein
MIARLANDDAQVMRSDDLTSDSLAASVDQLNNAARTRSWHGRGPSQVVFNGPPADLDPGNGRAPGSVSDQR